MSAEGAFGFLIGFAMGIVLATFWGMEVADRRWKSESVKAGVAEWVNGEDGTPQWQWKPK